MLSKKYALSFALFAFAGPGLASPFSGGFLNSVTPGQQGAGKESPGVVAFCKNVAPAAKINELLPRPSGANPGPEDIKLLIPLYSGLSLTPITEKSIFDGIDKESTWLVALFAAHVRDGNLVSAQMVLSLSPFGIQKSNFGLTSRRFLESAYQPFMESLDKEEKDLNHHLRLAQSQIIAGMKAVDKAAESAFARWHVQSHVYHDEPAKESTRQALCANSAYRSLVPATLKGVKAVEAIK